jgi:AAA domain-containing protein
MLPVEPAARLAQCPEAHRWLVEGLWAEEAVGIVGGEPKCGKSFLALDVAVAVASGARCLRRFAVPRPGRVLLYAAEDPLDVVRRRIDGICRAAGVAIDRLDLHVITAPALRLDVAADRQQLTETVAALQPRLLVLDPFVRLHRVDENAAGEVAPLLAYLRDLQRQHQVAVMVVHHARKGAAHRAGQALRGSSEFHAWGDSNLYVRRVGDPITLAVEHRAAPSGGALAIALRQCGDALALEIVDRDTAAAAAASPRAAHARAPVDRIERALTEATGPLTVAALRAACHMRTATLCDILAALVGEGRVRHTAAGYILAVA